MTALTRMILTAALGGTALAGAAYAAQDQAAPAPQTAMHRPHHGHGDLLAKLDTNGDGIVTRAEAVAAADARFAKADTNGDGRITQDELQARRDAARARMEQRRPADGQSAPSEDTGRSGGGMRHHGGPALSRLDADSDGVITKAEAEAAATQRFDAVDTNHDGKIDRTEIAAVKAQMQARMQARHARWQARRAAGQGSTATDQPAPADQ